MLVLPIWNPYFENHCFKKKIPSTKITWIQFLAYSSLFHSLIQNDIFWSLTSMPPRPRVELPSIKHCSQSLASAKFSSSAHFPVSPSPQLLKLALCFGIYNKTHPSPFLLRLSFSHYAKLDSFPGDIQCSSGWHFGLPRGPSPSQPWIAWWAFCSQTAESCWRACGSVQLVPWWSLLYNSHLAKFSAPHSFHSSLIGSLDYCPQKLFRLCFISLSLNPISSLIFHLIYHIKGSCLVLYNKRGLNWLPCYYWERQI